MSYGLVEVNGQLYAAGRGIEVWKYEAGTSWTDIAPSAGSGIVVIDKWENNLVVSKNTPGGMTVFCYDGATWSQINNPGFGNSDNFGTDSFATVNGELYVAAHNNVSGVEIYKYEGGTIWSQINADGFGDSLNTNAYMTSYNGQLYASTWNSTGTEVYRYDGLNTWTQVAPKGLDKNSTALHFAEINGTLYGSAASSAGAVVFEYQGDSTWLQVNEDGFGEGITGATQLTSFNNELYLGGGGQAADDIGAVYKYNGGTDWERILDDGLGNPNNRQITLWSYGNILYATTFNPTDGVEVYRYLQAQNNPMIVHFGTGNTENVHNYEINLMDARTGVTGLNIADLTIETQESAQNSLDKITDAIIYKDKIRASLGATQNRLENTIANLEIQTENLQAAESRISDADMAKEMTEFVKSQILTQSATAMLAQANSLPEMALQLIQGQRR
jgi:flagellin